MPGAQDYERCHNKLLFVISYNIYSMVVKENKSSVLHRQSTNTSQNIKMMVYCRIPTTFREHANLSTVYISICTKEVFVFVFIMAIMGKYKN